MLTIYGASDDLVEIAGTHPDADEIGCYDQDVVVSLGDDKGGAVIAMHYSGEWSAEISPRAEGVPIPWAIRVRGADKRKHEPDYSAVVEIDCPDDAPLKITKRSAKLRARAEQADDLAKAVEELQAVVKARDKTITEQRDKLADLAMKVK